MDPLALLPPGSLPVFGGAVLLGLVHGAEPGHGWPIAATYALDREHKWGHGLLASVLLGLGHLVSSLAVVAVFFLAKRALDLQRLNEPYVVGDIAVGGPVGIVAGALLIGLGVREYRRRGHGHGEDHRHDNVSDHGHSHEHEHPHEDDHEHSQVEHGPSHEHEHAGDHAHASDHEAYHHREGRLPDRDGEAHAMGVLARLRSRLPFVDDGGHEHPTPADLDRKGLAGLVWTAFVLGFVHEEEFEIIGLCLGSTVCLELMLVYAVAVMAALVGMTMLLIAGYYRYEDRMERYAEHFPTISAVVLVAMGLGFVLGLF